MEGSRFVPSTTTERIHWARSTPFFALHALPLLAFFTGATWMDWAACFALYYVRMFGITAGYHRYFAHRSYKMGRVAQFLMAFLGTTSSQKGVLWWAAHHRDHHRYSDGPEDIHSPRLGVMWSHVSWILCTKHDATKWSRIQDFAKYPELVWLNKYWAVPPTMLGVACFLVGGWSMLLIGFFLSTVLLWHGTFLVNSAAHIFGTRRFETTDDSKNSWWIALLTCGEGWHNNHHHYSSSANQGFYWWEIDLSYYGIKALQALGVAWDVRKPLPWAYTRNRIVAKTAEPLPAE
jgi:stearoyl-CoA desaturase (Delta-9 desaturase)